MTIPTSCDVVVIGGGPAGSLTATFLVQKGYKVVLFDKQKHPRYQVGESLIPDFWRFCDLAGVTEKIEQDGFIRKAGGIVTWDGHTVAQIFKDFGFTRMSLHVERDRFDFILLNHARDEGVQVFEEVAVSNVKFEAESNPRITWRSISDNETGELNCTYVVDASGQSSVIGRQLGIRHIDQGFRFMSVWGYFTNSRYVSIEGKIYAESFKHQIPPATCINSLKEFGDAGWSWHIMQRNSTSVGVVIPIELIKQAKSSEQSWENFLIQRCQGSPILSILLEQAKLIPGSIHMIRDYSYRSSQVAGPNFFLVGDAAGFVDPVFSVGVLMGMYSAYSAAYAIDRSFKHPEKAAKWQEMFAQQLQGRLEVARSLALPRYVSGEITSELAKSAMRLERGDLQDLMYSVSSLTTRSDNFLAMLGEDSKQFRNAKLHPIEKISFV